MLTFLLTHLNEFIAKLLEQLLMVFGTIFFAILLGIPLGILALRNRVLKNSIVGTATILQIIPGLALQR